MRAISKGQEPAALVHYRTQPGAEYDGANFSPVKNAVRAVLLQEQGSLCAYCMGRIPDRAGKMKIEHWHSQSGYPNEQLLYNNMLGCCMGNQGSAPAEQHCGTKQQDRDIKYSPANSSHHRRMQIRYTGDGRIVSDDPDFDRDLNETLNLNQSMLVRNRKAVVEAYQTALGNAKRPGIRTRAFIEKLLNVWNATDNQGCLKPYCGVAVYYLEKKLGNQAHV